MEKYAFRVVLPPPNVGQAPVLGFQSSANRLSGAFKATANVRHAKRDEAPFVRAAAIDLQLPKSCLPFCRKVPSRAAFLKRTGETGDRHHTGKRDA